MYIRSGELVIISSIKKYLHALGEFQKSLQFRIFIFFILVGTIPLFILKYGMLYSHEEQMMDRHSAMIRNQCAQISKDLVETGYLEGQTSNIVDVELAQLARLYNGRVVVVDENFRIIKDTYGIDEGKFLISKEAMDCFSAINTTFYDNETESAKIMIPVVCDNTEEIQGMMVISFPTTDISQSRKMLNKNVRVLQWGVLALVIIFAFYISRFLVKPFRKVTKFLEESSTGVEDEEISLPDYTETQLLTDAYNKMMARMKELDDSRQEFVSNVSHELKTPITSMKVLADSLLMQPDAPLELYQEFMKDMSEEIDRENKIINDLLSLVKMDKKAGDIHIQPTNINELLELILKRLRPIADKREVELVMETFRTVTAEVDEMKLTLALSNLVENAIKYNKEGGWVHISLNVDHKYFYVKIEDSGIGIPEESQERIFERFYRVDKSHSREIGGTGLGLAITRNAILMHRGAIKVYSKEGEGTTFTVRIPINYVG
ncbi:MAG: ATP-binding protein [Lachnospiraceae bacterium]|nr:ATP-binding protein [Robinsoniella sp.]MDY3766511.1 ATP-binding protein [Lachnospiraceae bacterium]